LSLLLFASLRLLCVASVAGVHAVTDVSSVGLV
jgi:hypothetical protein